MAAGQALLSGLTRATEVVEPVTYLLSLRFLRSVYARCAAARAGGGGGERSGAVRRRW